jgi:NADH-quinone oxidoreductase subunit E
MLSMDPSHMLSDAACQKIQSLMAKYPRNRSALIPALQIAQEEAGYLSSDVICEIARIFELAPNEVQEVLSFYSMLQKQPVGKYRLQVCTNISCLLCNAEEIVAHLERRLGIKGGETTSDMKYTLIEVECLGSCGTSPVIRINEDYYENITPEKLDAILDGLQ